MPIFQLRLTKGALVFQLFFKGIFQFLNFSVMLNICIANFKNIRAILENLSGETKNLNFDFCKISLRKILMNIKIFDAVFSGARRINRTVSRIM